MALKVYQPKGKAPASCETCDDENRTIRTLEKKRVYFPGAILAAGAMIEPSAQIVADVNADEPFEVSPNEPFAVSTEEPVTNEEQPQRKKSKLPKRRQ